MSHCIALASRRIRTHYDFFHSASRSLSSSSSASFSPSSSSAPDGGIDGGGEASLTEEAVTTTTTTAAAAAAASSSTPPPTSLTELFLPDASAPVAAAASLLDAIGPSSAANHAISLPWWAAIPTAAFAVRVSLLPLAAAQARSAAALGPLLQRARADAEAEAAAAAAAAANEDKEEEEEEEEKDPKGQKRPSPSPPSLSSTLRHLGRLRAETSSPSPAWLVASPLLQVPVFASAVWGVRAMASAGWPGFAEGGTLWFPDLTARAVEVAAVVSSSSSSASAAASSSSSSLASLASLTAPMGLAGGILPALVAAGTLAAAALGPGRAAAATATASSSSSSSSSSPQQRRPGSQLPAQLRLLLEWLALPAFVGSLALPQAAALYWASSTAAALAQGAVLRSEPARRFLGLREVAERAAGNAGRSGTTASPAAAAAAAPAPASVSPAAAVLAHLTRAAELRASGDVEAAIRAASAAVEAAATTSNFNSSSSSASAGIVDDDDDEQQQQQQQQQQSRLSAARAYFALGQLRTTAAHWHDGELAFGECARLEEEAIEAEKAERKKKKSDKGGGAGATEKTAAAAASSLFFRERKHEVARALFGAGVCQSMQGDNEAAAGTLRRACAAAAEAAAAAEGKDNGDGGVVAAAARATLARSSLALSSSLDSLGKTEEALEAAERAAAYDGSARRMAVEPLREKLRAEKKEKGL